MGQASQSLTQLAAAAEITACRTPPIQIRAIVTNDKDAEAIEALLGLQNGFYAFEDSLHVFPCACMSGFIGYSLEEWNESDLWKEYYEGIASEHLFFAEDIYGEQFGLRDGRVYRFNPETADITEFAGSIYEWAEKLLENPNFELGVRHAREWRRLNGKLSHRVRLIPKVPFVL